jgi:hypothetical protein
VKASKEWNCLSTKSREGELDTASHPRAIILDEEEAMAASARKSEPAPSSASGRLEAAQAALEEANRKLAELNARRNECLLADDNAAAIELGVQITNLKLAARAHEDKIVLLREKAAEEERARRAKEREAVIAGIEKKIQQRDAAMEGVAAAIKQLTSASERAIELGRDIIGAWSWAPHDLPAALLSPPAIMTAISHELYKCSYHPRRYGGQDTDPLAGVMLPGGRCPRMEWVEEPARTRAMVDVVRDASEFAKNFLRTGKGSAQDFGSGASEVRQAQSRQSANGGEPVQRSEAEQRLSDLLKQMSRLAEDVTPAGEAEYLRVVSEIARVQAEVAAQQQMERQHG